jgi:hypothetical protein
MQPAQIDTLSSNLSYIAQAAGSTKGTNPFHTMFAVKRKAQCYQALLQGSPLLLGLWWSSLLHLLGLALRAARGTLH